MLILTSWKSLTGTFNCFASNKFRLTTIVKLLRGELRNSSRRYDGQMASLSCNGWRQTKVRCRFQVPTLLCSQQLSRFELLGATNLVSREPFRSEHSFTTALISALEHLVDHTYGGGFDTQILFKIIKSAPYLRTGLKVILIDRKILERRGCIVLEPHGPKSPNANLDRPFDVEKGQDVFLRFNLAKGASHEQIESLIRDVNMFANRRSIKLENGSMGGLSFGSADRLSKALLNNDQQDQPSAKEQASAKKDEDKGPFDSEVDEACHKRDGVFETSIQDGSQTPDSLSDDWEPMIPYRPKPRITYTIPEMIRIGQKGRGFRLPNQH